MFKGQQLWERSAYEPSLFSPLEEYFTTHDSNGMSYEMRMMSETKRRKLLSGDGWLLKRGIRLVGEFGMPQLQPYNGQVDFSLVSYKDIRKAPPREIAIHFFNDDYVINSTGWNRLPKTTYTLAVLNHPVCTPDFSLHVDSSPAENIYNTYRTRLVGAYWQSIGLQVIPTASWGAASSFSYCFDGLPDNSVIAVCGIGHARLKGAEILWYEAIKRLVQKKHPTTIIVYGGENPSEMLFGTPIVHFEDFIKGRLRKIRPRKKGLFQPVYPILNLGAGVEDGGEELLLAGGG